MSEKEALETIKRILRNFREKGFTQRQDDAMNTMYDIELERGK